MALEKLKEDSRDILRGFLTLDRWLVRLEVGMVSLLLFSMIGLSLYMILQQNLIKSAPTSWIDRILKVMVMWLGFMGASIATHYSHHINIEAVPRLVSARWKRWIGVASNLFAAVFCYLLCMAAVEYVHGEYREWLIRSTSINYQPAYFIPPLSLALEEWQVRLVIPFSFFIFTLRFLLIALAGILNLPLPELEQDEEEVH